MSGVGGIISINRDRWQNIVIRIYLNESGTEYYEIVQTPAEARGTGLGILNAAQMAEYFIESDKRNRRRQIEMRD